MSAKATIRPEHVALRRPDGTEQVNQIAGTILRRVFFGGTLAYDVQVGSTVLRVEEMSTRSWSEGDAVALVLAPEHLWVFPPSDQQGVQP